MPSTRNGFIALNKVSATSVYNLSFRKEICRHTGPRVRSLDVRLEKVDKKEEEDICASIFYFFL
jgi:hypothetical protein